MLIPAGELMTFAVPLDLVFALSPLILLAVLRFLDD
jgi:hypothetical protein